MVNTCCSDTSAEVALPGFLQVADDVDFVVANVIGAGGFGSVYTGTMTSTDLKNRCQTDECVVKRFNCSFTQHSWL